MKNHLYAEDIKVYWKTSQTASGTWIERAKDQIEKVGGKVLLEAVGTEPDTGREALLMIFELGDDRFKVSWPVLEAKKRINEKAARIQAATMMFHDIKAKCVSSAVVGTRVAFFSYLLLPDGRAVVEASVPELQADIPALFSVPQINNGDDVVDGEFYER